MPCGAPEEAFEDAITARKAPSAYASASPAAELSPCGNTAPMIRAPPRRDLRQTPSQPSQRPADEGLLMPAPLHDRPPRRPQTITHSRCGRRAQRVLTPPRLLIQELRAPQTHADLGMASEPNQLRLLIDRAAAPALERFSAIWLSGWCHESVFFLRGQVVRLSSRFSLSRLRSILCSASTSRTR